ncbi:hypothetical protein [Piscirickettsia salmonis]|nr:hypothetical protein [Piscirickettsia salmonis]
MTIHTPTGEPKNEPINKPINNRRAKRDDYKPSAVRVTQRYVP